MLTSSSCVTRTVGKSVAHIMPPGSAMLIAGVHATPVSNPYLQAITHRLERADLEFNRNIPIPVSVPSRCLFPRVVGAAVVDTVIHQSASAAHPARASRRRRDQHVAARAI